MIILFVSATEGHCHLCLHGKLPHRKRLHLPQFLGRLEVSLVLRQGLSHGPSLLLPQVKGLVFLVLGRGTEGRVSALT